MKRTFVTPMWLRCVALRSAVVLLLSILATGLSAQRQSFSLNENWKTALKSDKKWIVVNVPHNWDDYYGYRRLQHGNLHDDAVYKKTFTVKQPKAGKRFFLYFEGVGSYAKVLVNGKFVGSHAGGRTTFTLDITDVVKTNGTNNDLEVQASHPAEIRDLPWVCGGCSDERGFSEGSQPLGIFRPVQLLITDEVRIEPFGIHAWADINAAAATLHLNTTVKNYGVVSKNIELVHQVKDANGKNVKIIRQQKMLKPLDSIDIADKNNAIDNPVLWSVENPYLYRIFTQVKSNGKVIDEVVTDFGFRTVQWKTATNQFVLNGKPVFINGVAEYEHIIGQGHAFDEKQVRSRVKWLEHAGFNAFRDGHQPHHLLYGKLFNEKGILWWTQLSAHVWFDTPEFRNGFKKLLREWVIERRNDPAVVLWGLQNESKLPEAFARECTELVRSLDPTASSQRLVTTCNGGPGSDWDVPQNWTGTYGGNPDLYGQDLKRQVLVGEYGAWRTLDLHTEGGFDQNGIFSEDRMTLLMEKKIKLAESVKDSAAGHFFWILSSHDNPGRTQGGEGFRELDRIGPVNYKGLITPWEEPADVFYMYRSNYAPKATQPMVYIASHTWPNRWMKPGVKDSVNVYSNCDEVELFNDIDNVSLGRKKHGGFGTHFQWDHIKVQYNILYAVGYVNGKAVARDTIVLHHLPQSPNYAALHKGAQNITAPQAGYKYIYRVNAGGGDYTDVNGNTWLADRSLPATADNKAYWYSQSWTKDFKDMPAFFASQRRTFAPITGTKDDALFQTFRYGKHKLQYAFPLPDGQYQVELYFAEPWLGIGGGFDAREMRVFDVAFNDKVVVKDLDIWAAAGSNRAFKKVLPATVKGGRLVISFPNAASGQAIIAAIAIASKAKAVKAAPSFVNIQSLSSGMVAQQAWLDIGDKIFSNNTTQIHSLPPALFGADWLQLQKGNQQTYSFKVALSSDVYIAVVDADLQTPWIKTLENAHTQMVTDENGGTTYHVFKKRYDAGTVIQVPLPGAFVAVFPASQMQPAYDLKATTSYKADVAVTSEGVVKELFSGSDRNVIKTDNQAAITWPVKTGVADIYAITVKYNYPENKIVKGVLQMTDISGVKMIDVPVELKFTNKGKWNYITANTGGMINAGSYEVKLIVTEANNLMVSNIDIQ